MSMAGREKISRSLAYIAFTGGLWLLNAVAWISTKPRALSCVPARRLDEQEGQLRACASGGDARGDVGVYGGSILCLYLLSLGGL